MGAPPPFSRNSIDFGNVDSLSTSTIELQSAVIFGGATLTAEIRGTGVIAWLTNFSVVSITALPAEHTPPPPPPHDDPVATPAATPQISPDPVPFKGPIWLPPPPPATGTIPQAESAVITVGFTAWQNTTSAPSTQTATLTVTSPEWDAPVTFPLSATVLPYAELQVTCDPVVVNQGGTSTAAVNLSALGDLATVTLSTPATVALPSGLTAAWVDGTTQVVDPQNSYSEVSVDVSPGNPNTASLILTADADAPDFKGTLPLYWAAPDGTSGTASVSLTIQPLEPPPLRASPIPGKYASLGAAGQAALGGALGPEALCADWTGQYRAWQGGAIYWDGASADAYLVKGEVLSYYLGSYYPDVQNTPPKPDPATLDSYASAPADYGYPTVDSFTDSVGCEQCQLSTDQGIYTTPFGPFLVSNDAVYQQQGGPAGSLGLPLNDAATGPISGTAGLALGGVTPPSFLYQSFANGGIFAPVPANASPSGSAVPVTFSTPPGTATPYPTTIGGHSVAGSLYVEPYGAMTGLLCPRWGLITIPLSGILAAFEQTLVKQVSNLRFDGHSVGINSGIAAGNPPAAGYVQVPQGLTGSQAGEPGEPGTGLGPGTGSPFLTRPYHLSFDVGISVISDPAVQFGFWLEYESGNFPGAVLQPGDQASLRGAYLPAAVFNWQNTEFVSAADEAQAEQEIGGLLQQAGVSQALPSALSVTFMGESVQGSHGVLQAVTLADGTLAILASLTIESIGLAASSG